MVAVKRRCTRCGQDKQASDGPDSDFSAKTRWPDGTARTFQSWCKQCSNEHACAKRGLKPRKERKPRQTREERNAKNRAWHARKREEDPEWLERRRAAQRQDARLRRREAGVPERGAYIKDDQQSVSRIMVDPAPFLEWFDEWLMLRGLTEKGFLRHVFGERDGDNMDRMLHRYRNGESPRANLDTLDRVFVAADMAHLNVLLYPPDER